MVGGMRIGISFALPDILGCKVGSFPPTFLGLPLCNGHTLKTIWNPVIEKVERKFGLESELSFFRWHDRFYSFCIVKPLNLLHVFAQMSGLCGQSH